MLIKPPMNTDQLNSKLVHCWVTKSFSLQELTDTSECARIKAKRRFFLGLRSASPGSCWRPAPDIWQLKAPETRASGQDISQQQQTTLLKIRNRLSQEPH